jgi:energy-coupling factor transporter ATP-binding protein EcfA2
MFRLAIAMKQINKWFFLHMQLLHNVNQSGTTIIMVTHDIETTNNTRILKIKDGVIEDIKNRFVEPNSIPTPYSI